MELGKKIRQLRLKAGLTQEQLAEKLGVGPQAVSKWENAAAMPDITTLPLLSQVFGVTIDDLFDLTVEQRFCRIEHRMDLEDTLPQDVFLEYEAFLLGQAASEPYRKQATELLAYLYWHRMEMFAKKARRYAREAVRSAPGEKGCQWILQKTEGHAVWDWNIANHTAAIDFYRELTAEHPRERLPYLYLIDNLLADRRWEEAEEALARLEKLEDANPVMNRVYRAHIALARFDRESADAIMARLVEEFPEDAAAFFEAAQYAAENCRYEEAIDLYERSFEKTTRRPRFQDELQGIATIYLIQGKKRKAAETYGMIITLLETEWDITEGDELQALRDKRARLLAEA